jgi:excisionase family DNA binding protein
MSSPKSKSGKGAGGGPAVAAAYLRLSEDEVARLVRTQDVPGRQAGEEWRFMKAALQAWLGMPSPGRGLLGQIGALKEDHHRAEMLKDIYARRGRPMTEEG